MLLLARYARSAAKSGEGPGAEVGLAGVTAVPG